MGLLSVTRVPAIPAVAVLAVACSPGPSGAAGASSDAVAVFSSPKAAVLSWFAAVNAKDRQAALAHFEPRARDMADWGAGPQDWPTFSSITCSSAGGAAGRARVSCTFTESDAPAVGNPDSSWDVALHRQADGRWLIDNYGQG